MRILWDAPIRTDDGVVLLADVFTPPGGGTFPVLLSYGPYGKGLAFQDGYKAQWDYLVERCPELNDLTSNRYQNWEVADPELWTRYGYAIVRVDSRGTGRSPGRVDLWSQREAQDMYDCIEWAGTQSWSNGRVGLAGISYYAMNQYQVAALQPPHLAAMCPWEGASDWYREFARHGGILCQFGQDWFARQVATVQHGVGAAGHVSSVTGELVAGPETDDPARLAKRRSDLGEAVSMRGEIYDWHHSRNPDWSKVTVPMLSAANWGGQGLHLRGNVEAFSQAASPEKWLEIHGDAHWVDFYSTRGIALQRRFFDHYLKGDANGWSREPRVHLRTRHADGSFEDRYEHEWPLERTVWTDLHLSEDGALSDTQTPARAEVSYSATGPGVTFLTAPLIDTMEITGPMAATLFISSETSDADIFLVVRLFDPEGGEVTFMGALDPNTPPAQGWLRASHRAMDVERSLPYRPYHLHTETQPLSPGAIYELQVEVWPTSLVIPPGYRLGLTVRGNDYRYEGELSDFARSFHYANRGVGPFRHADSRDRPAQVFGRRVTIHMGGPHDSRLLVPIIPDTPAE